MSECLDRVEKLLDFTFNECRCFPFGPRKSLGPYAFHMRRGVTSSGANRVHEAKLRSRQRIRETGALDSSDDVLGIDTAGFPKTLGSVGK